MPGPRTHLKVARYHVIIDRQLGEQDYGADYHPGDVGHEGDAEGAIRQLTGELQEAWDTGVEGFFWVVGREVVDEFFQQDQPAPPPPGLRWPMEDDPLPPAPPAEWMTDPIPYRRTVLDLAARRGHEGQMWHSGGGIVGVLFTVGAGYTLFGTLAADGDHPQWTGFDYCRPDGSLVACIEVQERPFGLADMANPAAMADAIIALLDTFPARTDAHITKDD